MFLTKYKIQTMKKTTNQIFVITNSEIRFDRIEKALNERAKNEILIDIFHLSYNLENLRFQPYMNNAIIFTSDGIETLNSNVINFFKEATAKLRFRVYFIGDIPSKTIDLFEDFIQRIDEEKRRKITENELADEVTKYLKEDNKTSRKETFLAFRDHICKNSYEILKRVWDFSFIPVILFVIYAIYNLLYGNSPTWMSFLSNKYVVVISTFMALFLSMVIIKKSIIGILITREIKFNFLIGLLYNTLAVLLIFYSSYKLQTSFLMFWLTLGFAFFSYYFFIYCSKIRVELSSLREIHSHIQDSNKKQKLIDKIASNHMELEFFPMIANKSGLVFISNMHKSDWSFNSAKQLYEEFTNLNELFIKQSSKYKVFLDRQSILWGSTWRQHLLRGISECTYFVALLDKDYAGLSDDKPFAEWVLVESVYANLLRKSIAKPMILLVFKSQESMDEMKEKSVYGRLYPDAFSHESSIGVGTCIIENVTLNKIIYELEKINPMQLLGG